MSEEGKKTAVQVLLDEIKKLQVTVATLNSKIDNLTTKNEHRIIRSESLLKAILGLENVPDLSKMVSGKSEELADFKASSSDEVKMEELAI